LHRGGLLHGKDFTIPFQGDAILGNVDEFVGFRVVFVEACELEVLSLSTVKVSGAPPLSW